ncbi:MAG: hypothetical protein IT161_24570 [Bryobacterales bacterium]|nr:hypothetical protein [Bryobacterales bacterium]
MTRQWFVSALAFATVGAHANAQAPKNLTSLPPSAFEHVYRHVKHLQTVDTAAAASGRSSNLSAYYKNLGGLTQQQADAMRTVSLAALAELDALDAQAKDLILKARAEVRSRKLLPGQKPPDPPPQLAALQGARKAVLAKYRANLVQAVGPTAFARLEQALITKYKVGPQATAPNPGPGH